VGYFMQWYLVILQSAYMSKNVAKCIKMRYCWVASVFYIYEWSHITLEYYQALLESLLCVLGMRFFVFMEYMLRQFIKDIVSYKTMHNYVFFFNFENIFFLVKCAWIHPIRILLHWLINFIILSFKIPKIKIFSFTLFDRRGKDCMRVNKSIKCGI